MCFVCIQANSDCYHLVKEQDFFLCTYAFCIFQVFILTMNNGGLFSEIKKNPEIMQNHHHVTENQPAELQLLCS